MGGRYLITGVQLGMIKALSQTGDIETIKKLYHEVYEKQHIANSNEDIKKDVQILQNYLKS